MAHGSARHDFQPAPPKRGRSRLSQLSWRGQPDDEARSRNRRFALCADRTCAVLRPDAPAMRLDDLFRYRQSQSGILPKPLMRPVGVEALENPLQRILANARPVVIDDDFDLRLDAAADDAHLAASL